MSKKKALGQGLDALLGDDFNMSIQDVMSISIDSLVPNPEQPRQRFNPETMKELAESIRQQGVIQPILAEKSLNDTYMIIAGERRWRASREAGLAEVPVIVQTFSPEQRLEITLVENVQREDLTPLEEAKAYYHLMDSLNLSQQDVADKVGKKRSTVANLLRLLKLPARMKNAMENGELSAGHARAILAVTNPADQETLYSRIMADSLSVRDAEVAAVDMNRGHRSTGKRRTDSTANSKDPEISRLEEQFISSLGTKVKLKGTLSKGKIEISWYNQDDLERIYDLIVHDGR